MIHSLGIKGLKLHKYVLFLLAFCSFSVAACVIAQAYGIAFIINAAFLEKAPLYALKPLFFMLLAVIALRCALLYGQEYLAQRLAENNKEYMRQLLMDHMLRIGPLQQERKGEVVHLLTDGLDHIEAYIARYVPQLFFSVSIPLCMGIAITFSIHWVGIVLLITYPLIPFFMILIGRKAGAMNEEQWERMSLLSGHFLDVLQGITTLKVYNRSTEQKIVIGRMALDFKTATLRVLRVAFLSSFVLELVATISTALIAVYTGIALMYGEINFLPAFFILLLAPEFYLPLRELGSAFHTGMAGETTLKKIASFLSTPTLEPVSGTLSTPKDVNRIIYKDVSFSYTHGEHTVLHNINFTLDRSKKVMLVGESGAGKSTIAHLLLRLLSPSEGQIDVDGSSLLDFSSKEWRKMVTYVPQRPYVFQGTIRDNIAFGGDFSSHDIETAARNAEAHAFIVNHPHGYERILGEGGVGLSGGEIQRIVLARAFLRRTPILILDEVSAHLDVQTEELINVALQRLMENKIVLMIGHRIQTMAWADELLVMREGEIIQRGSFEDLRHRDGYFKELVTASLPKGDHNELL